MKRSPLHLELAFLARHKVLFATVLLCRGVWELVPMQVPLLAGLIVDGLNGKGLRLFGHVWPQAEAHDVVRIGVLGLLVVAVVYGLSAFAYTMAGARLDRGFVAQLRSAVVEKILSLSLDHHLHHGSGALVDRAVRDTDRLRGFTEQVFTRTLTNVVRTVYPIVMLFLIHPWLALVALVIVLPQSLATWRLQKRLHKGIRKSLASQTSLTASLQENLDGIETVKTTNGESPAVRQLQEQVRRVEADELATSRITAMVRCTIWFATGVGVALIWWQGSTFVLDGQMTLGALVAFTGFAELAYRPFRRFSEIVKTYRAGLASLERIQELLDLPPSPRIQGGDLPLQIKSGRMTFRGASFAYGTKVVLTRLDLDIEGGQLVAIVGPSGAGKSSLLRLISRLYEPHEGQVLIDGQALEDVTLESLRSSIAVVPQRPVIFSGTVYDNLRLAKTDASADDIRKACTDASALGFIEQLEDGFNTRLGRHGVSLSVGEVQRLAIARALLRQPSILLMDEPTAALDAISEAAVVQTLLSLRGKMTMVVVGHRVEIVRMSDRVILLERGRVLAEGTHAELLSHSPVHQRLFGATTATTQHAEPYSSLSRGATPDAGAA
jgi:ABC-type multidrug transport system fused ATPase/permease subunit